MRTRLEDLLVQNANRPRFANLRKVAHETGALAAAAAVLVGEPMVSPALILMVPYGMGQPWQCPGWPPTLPQHQSAQPGWEAVSLSCGAAEAAAEPTLAYWPAGRSS